MHLDPLYHRLSPLPTQPAESESLLPAKRVHTWGTLSIHVGSSKIAGTVTMLRDEEEAPVHPLRLRLDNTPILEPTLPIRYRHVFLPEEENCKHLSTIYQGLLPRLEAAVVDRIGGGYIPMLHPYT